MNDSTTIVTYSRGVEHQGKYLDKAPGIISDKKDRLETVFERGRTNGAA